MYLGKTINAPRGVKSERAKIELSGGNQMISLRAELLGARKILIYRIKDNLRRQDEEINSFNRFMTLLKGELNDDITTLVEINRELDKL